MCLWAFSQAAFQVIFWALWSMAPPSRTFLKGITTGVFMMKISGFWDRPLLLPFHGIPFIGSFGSTHKARSVQRGRRPLQALESLCSVFVCLRVFVLLTIGVVTVWDDCFKCKGSHHALNSNFRVKIGGIQSQNSSQYAPLGTRSVISWY